MSYARSPRPVCSITIGTSIMFSFFPTLLPRLIESPPRGDQSSSGLVIQKVEGLFAADSIFNPIDASILCQSRAHRLDLLFRLSVKRFHFALQLLLAHPDFFMLSNLVEQ